MSMYKFVFQDPIPSGLLEDLKDQVKIFAPEKENSEEEFILAGRKADAIFTLGRVINEQMLDKMGAGKAGSPLKAVGTVSVGFDHLPLEYLSDHKIGLINTPQSVRYPTAELAVGITLALIRQILVQDRKIREKGTFTFSAFEGCGSDLLGKTVGILGMGSIGSKVAEVFHVLGANIIYHQRRPASEEVILKTGAQYVSMDQLFSQADLISLHVPFIPEFYHLIDEKRIGRMKDGVILVNCARGKLIDEKALVSGLKSGKIGGAALDVFEEEPLITPDLLTMDNVVLTPHMGASPREAVDRMLREAVEGVLAFLQGEGPKNLVNQKVFVKKR